MKTQKYIWWSFLCCLLVIHTGCESFVDLSPPTMVRQDQYFKTQSDMTAAVNGVYGGLRSYYLNFYQMAEIPSDNTEANSGTEAGFGNLDRFTWQITDGVVQNRWLASYSIIARVNTILDRIDAVDMEKALKDQYVAEAKFVRALMYFNLVQFFGDVPLVVHEIKTEGEAYTYLRTPVADIYTQIVNDLADAGAVLPLSFSGNDLGRPNRGAAKGLLGKVYVTLKQYDKALPVLKDVIESGVHRLLPDYEEVFRVDNKNNEEIIYSIQYLGNGNGEGSNFANSFAPRGSGTEIVSGGNPSGANCGTLDLLNAFEEGDLRKSVAIVQYDKGMMDRYTRKFIDRPISASEGNNSWPILRYPDVLLLYAEALAESGQIPEALIPLNEVRQRAGLAALQGLTQPDLRLAIEQERRVELCFEGHRWFDLLRTGRMVEVMTAYKEKYKDSGYLVNTYDVSPHRALFPIPNRERSLNPDLIQNPGY